MGGGTARGGGALGALGFAPLAVVLDQNAVHLNRDQRIVRRRAQSATGVDVNDDDDGVSVDFNIVMLGRRHRAPTIFFPVSDRSIFVIIQRLPAVVLAT